MSLLDTKSSQISKMGASKDNKCELYVAKTQFAVTKPLPVSKESGSRPGSVYLAGNNRIGIHGNRSPMSMSAGHTYTQFTPRNITPRNYKTCVNQLSWHESGQYLITSSNSMVQLWDIRKEIPLQTNLINDEITEFQWRGNEIWWGDKDGALSHWDLSATVGTPNREMKNYPSYEDTAVSTYSVTNGPILGVELNNTTGNDDKKEVICLDQKFLSLHMSEADLQKRQSSTSLPQSKPETISSSAYKKLPPPPPPPIHIRKSSYENSIFSKPSGCDDYSPVSESFDSFSPTSSRNLSPVSGYAKLNYTDPTPNPGSIDDLQHDLDNLMKKFNYIVKDNTVYL